MSDNKQPLKSGNMGLLQDIFGAAGTETTKLVNDMVDAFPAFLNELTTGFKRLKEGRLAKIDEEKAEANAECVNENDCELIPSTENQTTCLDEHDESEDFAKDEEEFDFKLAYKSSRNTIKYNEAGDVVNIITYTGIPDALLEKPYAFFKWVNKVYADALRAAFMLNCNLNNVKSKRKLSNDVCVTELRFELFSETKPKTILVLMPWHWDKEMRSFYYVDEYGYSNYVRFFIHGNEAEVCMKDNSVVTERISDADRAAFINMMHTMSSGDEKECEAEVTCDKMSENENTCDNLSCSGGDEVCGTQFDIKGMPDNDKQSEDKEETLADILGSYDFRVYESSRRDDDNSNYSPLVKKIYKDILYKDSCAEKTPLTTKDMLKLFDYMLMNNLFDHSDAGSKIIISVSYEEMMANIDKPEYEGKTSPVSSRLPWFMVPGSGPHFKVTDWENLDKKLVVDAICEYYNFDEVVLIDKQTVKGEKREDHGVEHYFLCSFEAM